MNVVLGVDFSGGHLYPALTFAKALKQSRPRLNVLFTGANRSQEEVIKGAGFISIGFKVQFRQILLESFLRFFEAIYILLRFSPSRVYGFGGRNSFFLILIASFFRPTYIYEPNVVLGKANKILIHFCRRTFRGIRNTEKTAAKEIYVGVPIRQSIIAKANISPSQILRRIDLQTDRKYFTVFIFGGSKGSLVINNTVTEALKFLQKNAFQFIHITGQEGKEKVEAIYREYGFFCFCRAFFDDMGILYQASHLVVCRGGASSLAEINFFSRPAIVVPYPYASGHQRGNAEFLARKGCILVKEEKDFTPLSLATLLMRIRNDEKLRERFMISHEKVRIWTRAEEFASLLWP